MPLFAFCGDFNSSSFLCSNFFDYSNSFCVLIPYLCTVIKFGHIIKYGNHKTVNITKKKTNASNNVTICSTDFCLILILSESRHKIGIF